MPCMLSQTGRQADTKTTYVSLKEDTFMVELDSISLDIRLLNMLFIHRIDFLFVIADGDHISTRMVEPR